MLWQMGVFLIFAHLLFSTGRIGTIQITAYIRIFSLAYFPYFAIIVHHIISCPVNGLTGTQTLSFERACHCSTPSFSISIPPDVPNYPFCCVGGAHSIDYTVTFIWHIISLLCQIYLTHVYVILRQLNVTIIVSLHVTYTWHIQETLPAFLDIICAISSSYM